LSACGANPTALPATTGELWQDAHIFTAVSATLDAARSRVLVEMYEFGRPDLVLGLIAARTRGAEVRVILDPTVPPTLASARRLAAAGVPVRFYPVDDHALQIDHVKLLVGDDRALVGGMNWGVTSARNHDYALLLRAPADLTRLAAIFDQDWALAGGSPAPLPAEEGPIVQTAPGSEIRRALESALASARDRIEAEVFDLTDPDLQLLLEQARRRGVGVRVLLDPGQAVNRPAFAELRRTSVEVRWFRPAPGAKLHAKVVLADNLLVLGSANWSHHGLDVNHELDVSTADAHAVAAYSAQFEADWQAAA
jgi:cardiolipin synthase A/B